ncbi:MAG: hypothetical protein ACJAVV_003448 [Alphaproteobacteria bacterium]
MTYLKNNEKPLAEVGVRFMHKMVNPSFEVHATDPTPPNQITIVEWDSADGLNKPQANDVYQEHTHLLRTGTSRFERHLVKVPTPKA